MVGIAYNVEPSWRLFTKGIAPEEVESEIHIDGDARLGRQVLQAVAIIA